MTSATENLLLHSIEKYELLLLKCDGLNENKKIPDEVLELLKEKYDKGTIRSLNKLFKYDLDIFDLLVILLSFYTNFIFVLCIF